MRLTDAELCELGIDPAAYQHGAPSAFGEHWANKATAAAVPAWNPSDFIEAHSQILPARIGAKLPAQLHPIAAAGLDLGRAPSLMDLAGQFCVAQFGPQARGWGMREILASGAGTAHLASVLVNLANNQILDRQPDLLGKALAVCRSIELKDYRSAHIATIELEAGVAAPTTNFGEWQTLMPTGSGESMRLLVSPVRVRFSEQLAVNDDIGALLETIRAAHIACAQNELETLFAIVNDNPNLSDGAALFNAGALNLLTGQSKDVAALNGAAALLRSQLVNGKPADCDPALLVVPAIDEATARLLAVAASSPVGAPWLQVIATSYMDAGNWLMLANPAVWPVLARATMRGSNGVSLRFGPGSANEKEGVHDTVLESIHSAGYGPVSRVGGVRIAVS